jgi:hypothetical protein
LIRETRALQTLYIVSFHNSPFSQHTIPKPEGNRNWRVDTEIGSTKNKIQRMPCTRSDVSPLLLSFSQQHLSAAHTGVGNSCIDTESQQQNKRASLLLLSFSQQHLPTTHTGRRNSCFDTGTQQKKQQNAHDESARNFSIASLHCVKRATHNRPQKSHSATNAADKQRAPHGAQYFLYRRRRALGLPRARNSANAFNFILQN